MDLMTENQTAGTMPQFTESEANSQTSQTDGISGFNSLGPSVGYFENENPNTWVVQVPQNRLLPEGYTEVLDVYNIQYLNGYLRTQIGNFCSVQLLLGISGIETREGILIGVGVNYIILKIADTEDTLILDFYSIKTIKVYA